VSDPLAFLDAELRRLAEASLLRVVRPLDSPTGPEVVRDGRRLVLLASNDYLGLAADPRVTGAAAEAARRWGAGAGSARLVAGALRLHDELEARLAAFKGAEAALLFSSGYLANLGAITALVGRGDAVFSDALNHASIVDAARLSRADVHVWRHRDVEHLAALLRERRDAARRLVVTDSVFSMDGDVAPLADLVELCEREGAILMVDEAHATGVVGPGGRGAVAAAGLEGRVPVVMTTLSKALGAAGGAITGSARLVAFLRNRARSFVFDTAPAPPAVAAALVALEILEAEPWRAERARTLALRLADGLDDAGFRVPRPEAAVVPVVVGEPAAALALAEALEREGVLVPAIRPPSVPPGTARLRATTTAAHADEHVALAVRAFERARAALDDRLAPALPGER
jgi:8-amino-7-oxononanoate synthase